MNHKNELENFVNASLIEDRLEHLPLMWEEAFYSESSVQLNFNIFDLYKQFSPSYKYDLCWRTIPSR